MQFVKVFKTQDYAEDYQDRPVKFAYAKKVGDAVKVLHDPVLCRSFLDDTLVWKAKESKNCTIYGYNFRGALDKKKTSLYMVDPKGTNPLASNIQVIHKMETDLGLPLTKVYTEDNMEFYIEADKWWMSTTVHFSFFTYLLRQLTYNKDMVTIEQVPHGNFSGASNVHSGDFHKILQKLKVFQVSGYSPDYLKVGNGSEMHQYNGFGSQFTSSKWTAYGEQIKELSNGLLTS